MKNVILLIVFSAVFILHGAQWKGEKLQQWRALRNAETKIENKNLHIFNIKADPQIECKNISIDPQKFNAVRIRYRAYQTGPRSGQLFFSRTGSYSERQKWTIPSLKRDGKWHTLILTSKALTNVRNWHMGGVVTQLRLDPTDSAGGTIEIAEIAFFNNEKNNNKVTQNSPENKIFDAPLWPKVTPEFNKHSGDQYKGVYFQGKMIRSPHDRQVSSIVESKRFYLRRSISLKDVPEEAWIQFAADDACDVFLNGKHAGINKTWTKVSVEEVSDLLKKGNNIWAFSYDNHRSAGGVLAELFVKYKDGSWQKFNTDDSFKTTQKPGKNWKTDISDNNKWEKVVLQSPPPADPWTVRLQYFDFLNPQKLLKITSSKSRVAAGEKVRIQIYFEGNYIRKDMELNLSLDKGNTHLWDEFLPIPVSKFKKINSKTWKMEFDYTFPLYLNSNPMTMTLASDSLFIQSGGIPKLNFDYQQLTGPAPGYEAKTHTAVKRTPYGPALFKNGKPFNMTWGLLTIDRRADKRAKISDAKLTVMTVFARFSRENDKLLKEEFDRFVEKVRRDNPDAWIIADVCVNPSRKWAEENPEELCRDDKGNIPGHKVREYIGRTCYSFASEKALHVMEKQLKEAVAYIESRPYANRIIGYRVTGGHTNEWLGWDAARGRVLDFSIPAQKGFKKFVQKHYPELKDYSIPTLRERQRTGFTDLLPDRERFLKVIAYHEFYNQVLADKVIRLCTLAKKLLKYQKVVGTYYGYTVTLHGPGNSQMRAHYNLQKVLESRAVDFLFSPQAYAVRNLGDTCGDMKPFKTMLDHNVIPVIEDDTRTHNSAYMTYSGSFQTLTEKASIAVMRRNAGIALSRNLPMYYYPVGNPYHFDFPAMKNEISTVRTLGEHCLLRQTPRKAEIAIVVSEETIKSMPIFTAAGNSNCYDQAYKADGTVARYMTGGNPFCGESFLANLTRYARIGAPVDYLLAEDLVNHPGNYKLYFFINCYKSSPAFQKTVEKLRQKKNTLVWISAPGYMTGRRNSVAEMKKLTAVPFEKMPSPTAPYVKMKDGRMMGSPSMKLDPMFCVPASFNAETLGTYPNGKRAVVSARTGKATTVYTGAYQFDMKFLTELAQKAGVFLYSTSSDPMEANEALFTLHARFPGKKEIRLPRKTTVVDVFNRKIVARNTDRFTFDAPLHSSWLFYYGDDAEALLKKLKKVVK